MSTATLLALLAAPAAFGCPAAVFNAELAYPFMIPRDEVRLVARTPAGAWQALPLQIDPLDDQGRLLFFPDDAFKHQIAQRMDLLTFRVDGFGPRVKSKDQLPCKTAPAYEVRAPGSQRYAYLVACPEVPAPLPVPVVQFDKPHSVLVSDAYRYRFNPSNYMQFDAIDFSGRWAGAWNAVASDSRLLIRADVKDFFTMSFDSKQIESKLEDSRLGPVGDLARLSFYLKILVFKIKMSLSTDVGFYRDSGRIPMMVSIPVNAYEYLRPASGILYSWVLSPAAAQGSQDIRMPRLDPALVHQGYKELAKVGLPYCHGGDCTYHWTVDVHGRRLAMDLGIRKDLVERGFFPTYVDDAAKMKTAMGWELDTPPGAPKRMGLYFEVSGLPEGEHPWDFWLRLGGPKEPVEGACPAPLQVVRLR